MVFSQTMDNSYFAIHGKAFLSNDNKVYLRWAPGNYETWDYGNTHGYRVERYILMAIVDDVNLDLNNTYVYKVCPNGIDSDSF